jgi:hypothetical protein
MVFLLTPDIGEFIEEAKEKSVTAITLLSNRKKLSRAQRRRHPERAACLCGALVRSSRPARLGRHLEWQYARADHAIFPPSHARSFRDLRSKIHSGERECSKTDIIKFLTETYAGDRWYQEPTVMPHLHRLRGRGRCGRRLLEHGRSPTAYATSLRYPVAAMEFCRSQYTRWPGRGFGDRQVRGYELTR